MLILKCHSPLKGTKVACRNIWFQDWERKEQHELGAYVVSENKEALKEKNEACQKYIEASLKGTSTAQFWDKFGIKIHKSDIA